MPWRAPRREPGSAGPPDRWPHARDPGSRRSRRRAPADSTQPAPPRRPVVSAARHATGADRRAGPPAGRRSSTPRRAALPASPPRAPPRRPSPRPALRRSTPRGRDSPRTVRRRPAAATNAPRACARRRPPPRALCGAGLGRTASGPPRRRARQRGRDGPPAPGTPRQDGTQAPPGAWRSAPAAAATYRGEAQRARSRRDEARRHHRGRRTPAAPGPGRLRGHAGGRPADQDRRP